jgi:hypothetical protein
MRVLREELAKIQSAYIRHSCKAKERDGSDGSESGGDEDEAEDGVEDAEGDLPTLSDMLGAMSKRGEKEKLVNLNFNAKMSNVVSTCKDYFFQADFQALLDVQKDFRAVANGVIDLRSGELLSHHPRVTTL